MPTVSIGLPVYNGERYLAETLDSLVAQTFRDLEIVISDNASTDGTSAICEEYARRDARVRYARSATNVGAAANYNRVFELATGRYFKWAAHDDLCGTTFVERCVAVLDRDPEVVLAYPRTRRIGPIGELLPQRPEPVMATGSPRPSVRFESILKIHNCFEIFGVIRADALARTPLMGNYSHGDGVLLARLALLGRFEEIPETLFYFREHPDHSTTRYRGDYRSWAAWFDPGYAGGLVFPLLRMHYEYLRSIDGAPLPPGERLRCYREVLRWVRWRRGEIASEVAREAGVLARRAIGRAGRLLRRPP